MSSSTTAHQIAKILRGLGCSALLIGPYMYTNMQPETTLNYRFDRAVDDNGNYQRAHPTFNRFAIEMAYRMKLQENLGPRSKIDIRTTVHRGLDFDSNGNFSPIYNGMVYLVIPQWANLSSIDDLKKLVIQYADQTIDFSKINLSMLEPETLKIGIEIPKKKEIPKQIIQESPKEQKSRFFGWFSRSSSPPSPVVEIPPETPPAPKLPEPDSPQSREVLLLRRLIETFNLSDEAKKYIIGEQIQLGCGPWHVLPWVVVGSSFFLPFTLYTRLRQMFKTRLRRFLFLHFLLLNGVICFYFAPFLGRLINMQISRIRDSSIAGNDLDILEGAIEFQEKQLERNRILRELFPRGKNLFDPNGERSATRVEIPQINISFLLHHWNAPIEYRLKHLRKQLDKVLLLPEDQAKSSIIKQDQPKLPLQQQQHSSK